MSKFIKKKKEKYNGKSHGAWSVKIFFIPLCCAAMMIGVFFLYLGQVNSTVPQVYDIQELEAERDSLQEKNDKLRLEMAELESMENLEVRLEKLNLVKTEEIVYLEKQDVVVAAK